MSKILFTSDPHFGHHNCAVKYRGFASHDEYIKFMINRWNEQVNKRDQVWVLGDVGHNKDPKHLWIYNQLNGTKKLVLGNHDQCPIDEYQKYFVKIFGMIKYKNFWLTHCPIHPHELRNRPNVHGHMHQQSLDDPMYFNVNLDVNNYNLVTMDQLAEWRESLIKKGLITC